MKETKNPIAIQSKQWLTNALLDLMKEKPFNDIRISEIADKAGLSRRTFYRSFSSKEDILSYYFSNIWQQWFKVLSTQTDRTYMNTIKKYLEFWYQNKACVMLFHKQGLFSMLLEQYNIYFQKAFILLKPDYPLAKNPEAMGYALSYSAGGLLSILWHWADEGMDKTPAEVMELLWMALKRP